MKLTSQILSLTCLTPTFWPAAPIKQAGNESETLLHSITLLPGHGFLPKREKVLPMSPE